MTSNVFRKKWAGYWQIPNIKNGLFWAYNPSKSFCRSTVAGANFLSILEDFLVMPIFYEDLLNTNGVFCPVEILIVSEESANVCINPSLAVIQTSFTSAAIIWGIQRRNSFHPPGLLRLLDAPQSPSQRKACPSLPLQLRGSTQSKGQVMHFKTNGFHMC